MLKNEGDFYDHFTKVIALLLAKKRGWFLWPFYQGYSLTFWLKNEGDFYDHFTKVLALLFG